MRERRASKRRPILFAVELAKLLVDHRKHIVDAIGNRRVDRIAAVLDVAANERRPTFDPLRVARLGDRNEVGEKIDLL